jgi:hypothetical protein
LNFVDELTAARHDKCVFGRQHFELPTNYVASAHRHSGLDNLSSIIRNAFLIHSFNASGTVPRSPSVLFCKGKVLLQSAASYSNLTKKNNLTNPTMCAKEFVVSNINILR